MSTPLTHTNPNMDVYGQLRLSGNRWHLTNNTQFAGSVRSALIEDLSSETEVYIRSKIQGTTLVDIGCGLAPGLMYDVARQFGASAYIGVDLRGKEIIPSDNNETPKLWRFRGDMLETVAQLPNESANFVINGIDGDILWLNRKVPVTEEYETALVSEIARVTKPGGIVFGLDFYPIQRDLQMRHGFITKDHATLFQYGGIDGLLEKPEHHDQESRQAGIVGI